jgi:integrase/recombinase XerC
MIDSFIDYLQFERRYSSHTIVAYRKDVADFFEFIELQDLKMVSYRDIRGWMLNLLESGMKSTTVNRKLSSLRTFFDWLVRNGQIETTPLKLITGPKNEKRLPVFVKQSSLSRQKVAEKFEDDFNGSMDRLMMELFYQTGIRLSELIELKRIDFESEHIKVKGKRNKERIIPMSIDLSSEINKWIATKESNGYAKSDYVFSLKNGKKLYPGLVYRKINDYLSRATDVSKRSPHILRHTFATHLLNNGAGLEVIKELLGHSSLAATQVYTHNSFAELTKVYSQAHPRGRKD